MILAIRKSKGDNSKGDYIGQKNNLWGENQFVQFIFLFVLLLCMQGMYLVKSYGQEQKLSLQNLKYKNVTYETQWEKMNNGNAIKNDEEYKHPEYVELNDLSTTAVPEKKVLQLTIWNSQKFNNSQSLIDLQHLAQSTDFFLIQECLYNSDVLGRLAETSDFEWVGVKAFKYYDFFTGVITGSRYGSNHFIGFRSKQTEPIFRTPKSALISYFKTDSGLPLAIVNLHALNFVTNKKYEAHFLPLIDELDQFKGPLIMAGDFNTHISSRKRILTNWVEKLKLEQVPVLNDDRRLKLDHIYVRDVVTQPAIIRKDIKSADHFPIEMKFIIPQR